MQGKTQIRKRLLAWRSSLSESTRIRLEEMICRHISRSPDFRQAQVVALYMPVRGEVDLRPLWRTDAKTFVFPRVDAERLCFCPAGCPHEFKIGSYRIPEPVATQRVAVDEIDLIIVPGIAFDRNGYRLGYGKGYYDRLLTTHPGVNTMGVCFQECLQDKLIIDPWDTRVRYVVTQDGLFESEGEVQQC